MKFPLFDCVFLLPFHCRELLPKDFTVYTYDKEGKLQLEYPDVQVGFPSIHPSLRLSGMEHLGITKGQLYFLLGHLQYPLPSCWRES